jgi:rod shape determining protein RodA
MIVLLIGLYLANPIQNVHRWYRLPLIGMTVQPSEFAKLAVVISLAWFLERKGPRVADTSCALQMGCIVGLPFLLILKQPDLGTALVLYPITLVMGYFGGIHRFFLRTLSFFGIVILIFVALLFTGFVSHQKMRPFFTTFLKEYQYERLNPNTYHQKAAETAIAIGGVSGSGWHKSEFSSRKWLPAAHTDSVFAAYGEETGFIGMAALMFLFYALLYFCFQVTTVAKDYFGRLLAAGITIYLGMHIIMNVAMMCGFLPITGVPLVLVTYGGNSVLTTMAALGILQSIYTRRFMF